MPSHSMHPTHPTSLPRLPELRRATRARNALALLGIVFVGAATTAAGPAQAGSAQRTRVTVIGDSVSESLDYVPAAKRYLGRGLDLRSSVVVCRRLVAASCAFQGTQPSTALEYVTAQGHALGPVVVVDVGYNDWTAVYDVDRLMRALTAAGVRRVVWVTLREAGSNASIYTGSNARIRSAARHWRKTLVVADWNAYSHDQPWFREDGLHLTASGALGLARLLRPLVVAGARST